MGGTGFGSVFFVLVSVWYTWAFGLMVTSCMVWSVYSKHCSRLHDGHCVFRLPWHSRRGGSCGWASSVHTERYRRFRLLTKLYSRLVLNKKACAYPQKKPKKNSKHFILLPILSGLFVQTFSHYLILFWQWQNCLNSISSSKNERTIFSHKHAL